VYLEQPEGFGDGGGRVQVCQLKRSLYGLKQAPRCWNKRFISFMEKAGLKTAQLILAYFIAHMKTVFSVLQFMLLMDLSLVTRVKKAKCF